MGLFNNKKFVLYIAIFFIIITFFLQNANGQDVQAVYGYVIFADETTVPEGVETSIINNNSGYTKLETTSVTGVYVCTMHGSNGDIIWSHATYVGNYGNSAITYDLSLPCQRSDIMISGNFFPTANFTFSPLIVSTSDSVQFNDTSTDPEDGNVSTWSWDFGDGSSSTSQNPTHQYSSGGAYRVTLTVEDSHGASDSTNSYIIVESPLNGGNGGGPSVPSNIKPIADANGPYYGFVLQDIIFDGSESYDPDGEIVGYKWDFQNDGVFDAGWISTPTVIYSYTEAGNYEVKLAVMDNVGSSDTDTSIAIVNESPIRTMSNDTIDEILANYDITLNEPCFANDTDYNGIAETFVDPNDKLKLTKTATLNEMPVFLLSTNNDAIPEFFWDAEADKIHQISYVTGEITDSKINPKNNTITKTVKIEKESNWAYIKIEDFYPEFPFFIKTINNGIIESENLWRENGEIYILNNQSTRYQIIFSYTILDPTITPSSGTIVDTKKPTIIITYNEAVTILKTTLNNISINLTTSDNKTYEYTPQNELEETTYILSITVEDAEKNIKTSSATYSISIPKSQKEPVSTDFFSTPLFLIVVAITIFTIIIVIVAKKKYL